MCFERLELIIEPNMDGVYGAWAAGLAGDGPARFAFRNPRFDDLDIPGAGRSAPDYTTVWSRPIAVVPEVLGLRVPLPSLVQYTTEDDRFTLSEIRWADRMLTEVYHKAGADDRSRGTFSPGTHQFDLRMQAEAFGWFDHWLKHEH